MLGSEARYLYAPRAMYGMRRFLIRCFVRLAMRISRCVASIKRFLQDEDGPTAVEYCVIIMLILLAVLTAVQVVANATGDSLDDSSGKIDQAFNGS